MLRRTGRAVVLNLASDSAGASRSRPDNSSAARLRVRPTAHSNRATLARQPGSRPPPAGRSASSSAPSAATAPLESQVGDRTIVAADRLPDDLRDALAAITHAQRLAHYF